MIDTLVALIDCLYPNPAYGILTLKSNAPLIPIPPTRTRRVVVAIADAQQLNRTHSYNLSGLCEFHIGIIYAYWGDFAGARQQFILARRQWRFSQKKTAVSKPRPAGAISSESNFPEAICLTHFAEGYALEEEFAYEEAIAAYRKADQCLQKTEQQLQTVQTVQSATPSIPETDHSRQRTRRCNAILLLHEKLAEKTSSAHTQLFAFLTGYPLPKPKITRPPSPPPFSPIPGHPNNSSYRWYRVDQFTKDSLFPSIKANTYLLVDTTNVHPYDENALLLIKSSEEAGSITLMPYDSPTPCERIYLTKVTQTGTFTRNVYTGKVKFSSERTKNNIQKLDIVGFVIGIWRM